MLVCDGAVLKRRPDLLKQVRTAVRAAIVVELRSGKRRTAAEWRAACDDALAEAAILHRPVAGSPWLALAADKSMLALSGTVLSAPALWQELVLLRPRFKPAALTTAPREPSNLRVVVVPSQKEPEKADALVAHMRAWQLKDVVAQDADSSEEHIVVNLLKAAERRSVPARWLDGHGAASASTITTETSDGITLTADLYTRRKKPGRLMILFHQAQSSRGEYRFIARRLVAAGFDCLAIDQRSGEGWAMIRNETAVAAAEEGLPRDYLDALPDLRRSVNWARELGYKGKIGVMGSSYSASLVIFLGAEMADLGAVVSFSPGDYLPPHGSILTAARALSVPTLVICPPREEGQARQVFQAIASRTKQLYVQPAGIHGASTLDRSPTRDQAWERLLKFLKKHVSAR